MYFLKFFFLILFHVSLGSFGQLLISKEFTPNDNLPSSEVYCIHQDQKGFIWIGTDQGIAKYEGKRFETYTTNNGLLDNTILDIHETNTGDLWLSTMSSKMTFIRDGIVIAHPYSVLDDENSLIYQLRAIDSSGKKWMSGFSENYLYKETEPNIYTPFPTKSTDSTLDLTRAYYLQKINKKTIISSLFFVPFETDNFKIKPYGEGYLFTGPFDFNWTLFSRFRILNSGEIIGINYVGEVFIIDSKLSVSHHQILLNGMIGLYEDNSNNLWFYSANGVLFYKDGDLSNKPQYFFKDQCITDIIEDNEGNYWFTDHNNGLHFVPLMEMKQFVFGTKNKETRIACLKVRNGALWFSTIDREIWEIDSDLQPNIINQNLNSPYDFYPFEVFSDNKLFLPGGIIIEKEKITDKKQLSPGHKTIELIGENIVIGHISGVDIYDIKTGEYENNLPYQDNQGIVHPSLNIRVNAVLGKKKELWIGGFDGLYVKNENIINYLGEENELLQNRIMSLCYYKDDFILIGTKGAGLLIYNKKTKNVTSFGKEDGIPSNMIRCLFVSKKGKVYLGTNKGLCGLELNTDLSIKNVTVFNIHNSLPSNEINDIEECYGKIWIATTKGLVYIEEEFLKKNTTPPPIFITSISAKNNLFTNTEKEIKLSVDERNITIKFNSIGFRAGNRIQYKYCLDDFIEDTITTTNSEVFYMNMEPGLHTFSVWAINEDGVISKEPAIVKFSIPNRFVETLAFKVLIVLFSFLIVVFTFYVFYRRKKRLISNDLHTAELKQQALTALMNPHFIYNSLAAIQELINSGDNEKSNLYLSQFSRLIRQNLNAVRKGTVLLEDEVERLELYLKIEKMRFGEKLNYRIEMDEDIDLIGLNIPSMIIQPFVENAIWHGILPLEKNGLIVISFSEHNENEILVRIDDNGVGIGNSKTSTNKNHSSISMEITKQRLSLMGNSKRHQPQIKIIEKSKEDGGGTLIEIIIPIAE